MRSKLLALLLNCLIFGLNASQALAAGPSLFFSPANKIVAQNEQFEVEVLMDTAGIDSGGAGAKISFDKDKLAVVKIEPGLIFADYPALIIDNETGRVTISAVSSSANDLFNGHGVLATIKFRAKQTGQAKVSFIFQPGSTTDSNIAVTFGNGDALETVNQLSLTINQNQGGAASGPAASASPVTMTGGGAVGAVEENPVQQKAEVLGIKKWINSLFRLINWPEPFEATGVSDAGRTTVVKVDPNKPLTRQAPITTANQSQTQGDTIYVAEAVQPSAKNWLLLPEVYLPLLAALAVGGWLYWRKRKSVSETV